MVNSAEDYKNLLSRDREWGGSNELTYISHLFSNYLFRVHYEKSTNTVICVTKALFVNCCFSAILAHFDVLQNNLHIFKPYNTESNFNGYQLV